MLFLAVVASVRPVHTGPLRAVPQAWSSNSRVLPGGHPVGPATRARLTPFADILRHVRTMVELLRVADAFRV